jgi:hypothetical protein
MFDNKKLSNRQTDELFFDTAHRIPARTGAGAHGERSITEDLDPDVIRVFPRTAQIGAEEATEAQRANG